MHAIPQIKFPNKLPRAQSPKNFVYTIRFARPNMAVEETALTTWIHNGNVCIFCTDARDKSINILGRFHR